LFVLGFSYVVSGIYLTVRNSIKHKAAEPSETDEQESRTI